MEKENERKNGKIPQVSLFLKTMEVSRIIFGSFLIKQHIYTAKE